MHAFVINSFGPSDVFEHVELATPTAGKGQLVVAIAASGINPFALCNCADLGDTPVNPVDVMDSMARIKTFFDRVCDAGVVPLSVGGDHLVTLPVFRGIARGVHDAGGKESVPLGIDSRRRQFGVAQGHHPMQLAVGKHGGEQFAAAPAALLR